MRDASHYLHMSVVRRAFHRRDRSPHAWADDAPVGARMTRKSNVTRRCPASSTGMHLWIDPTTGRTRQKEEDQLRLVDAVCMACGATRQRPDRPEPPSSG